MKHIFFILLQFLITDFTTAGTITAVNNGDWHNTATWTGGIIPVAGDDVEIDGYSVTITTGPVSINSLTITNATASAASSLIITNALTVTISGSLFVTAENVSQDVELQITSTAMVNVSGNVELSRSSTNVRNNSSNISMSDDAVLNVSGNFVIDYEKAGALESGDEIDLYMNAAINITGNCDITLSGGNDLTINLYNAAQFVVNQLLTVVKTSGYDVEIYANGTSILNVKGVSTVANNGGLFGNIIIKAQGGNLLFEDDVTLTSNVFARDVSLDASGATATISIYGDLNLNAVSDGDAGINLLNNSNMNLKGSISRSTNYGYLNMDSNSTFSFNGSSAQQIPDAALAGSGFDAFEFTNLIINNTSGVPFSLEGPMVVETHLSLTEGIIATTSTNTITLLDQATIDPGNANAFIDGPLIKKGRTNGAAFVFPLGNNGIYAPLEIEEVTNSSDQFTAQYFHSEAADRASLNIPLTHISKKEYWTLSKTTGSKDVNVSLHWQNAAQSGINDMASLVIAMYDVNAPGMGWKSIGQGNNGGSALGAASGWLVNDLLCPPPIEDGIFTFGSTDNLLNPLPADILEFTAHAMDRKIMVQWLTTSERNLHEYEVERSNDGIDFQTIKKVKVRPAIDIQNVYYIMDELPANGANYYRLKIVDKDRSYSYSKIVNVKYYIQNTAVLQPNPVADYINLVGLDTEDGNIEIRIYSMEGRLVYLANLEIEERELRIPVNHIIALQKGNYVLQYTTADQPKSIRFLKE